MKTNDDTVPPDDALLALLDHLIAEKEANGDEDDDADSSPERLSLAPREMEDPTTQAAFDAGMVDVDRLRRKFQAELLAAVKKKQAPPND